MPRNYTREQQRRYREKRREQALRVASRLMGKRQETLFQTDDEWKWKTLKGRQMGMSMYNNLLVTNPRASFIISGMEGV